MHTSCLGKMSSFIRRNRCDSYHQYDDRGPGYFSERHVSFKPGMVYANRLFRARGFDTKIRNFNDEDNYRPPMNQRTITNHFRFNPVRGNGGPKYNDRQITESSSGYYQVILCYSKKYTTHEVIKALQSFLEPIPLSPLAVKIDGENMTFYVDNYKTAQSLITANLKFQMDDGWKVQIKVVPNMPFVELNPGLEEKIKSVMSSKYDAMAQYLDLSKFHANEGVDPQHIVAVFGRFQSIDKYRKILFCNMVAEFTNNDMFVPLNRPKILVAVFQIIAESIPNLRSLNLSDNKIFSTDHLSLLKRHASDLKSLDLSKNKIQYLSHLNCLQGLQLECLVLDENPLCDKFEDQTTFVREIRRIFRMLSRLNGVDLPPPVDFDVEENTRNLPESCGSFMRVAEGHSFSQQFLEQYFNLYDNQQSRDAVAKAYTENAQFSMTAFSHVPRFNLNRYILESRNLRKVFRFDCRSEKLHVGRNEIVRFLNTLPKTQHDLTSFTVDLSVFTPNLVSLTICGVFRETEVSQDLEEACMKAFTRTFVLVSTGIGFNIVNDMLSITCPGEQLQKMAFQQPPTISGQSPGSSLNVPPIVRLENSVPVTNPQEQELVCKREMVSVLSSQTEMNLTWSEKCLAETNWNFDAALFAFTEFNKRGEIPQEAFNK